MRRISAIIAQAFSYATTLAAAAHIMRPTSAPMWAITAAVALAFEALFFGMKETLFDSSPNLFLGSVGVGLDALVNTGGALTFAGRILTFGPVALMLGLFGFDATDPTVSLVGTVVVSAILGITLSIAPHLLWRKRRRARSS